MSQFSDARLSAVLQNLSEIIWIVDQDIQIQYASPSVMRILGYAPEDFCGRNGFEFIHPDDFDTVRRKLNNVMSDINGHHYTEVRVRTAQGDWRPLEIVAENLLNHPEIKGLVLTGRDISERMKTEETLRISEQRYRDVVENASEGIVVLQGNKGKFFNQKIGDILGYSISELHELKIEDMVYPEDLPSVMNRYTKRLKGDSIEALYHFRCMHRKGNVRWLKVNAVLIQWEGEPATLNFVDDITEQKTAEEFLSIQYNLARALNQTIHPMESLRLCMQAALKLTGMDNAGIYDIDEKTGSMSLVCYEGLSKDFADQVSFFVPEDEAVAIVKEGKPVFMKTSQLPTTLAKNHLEEGIYFLSIIPVEYENKMIASLNMGSRNIFQMTVFIQKALVSITAQMGAAIMRSRVRHALIESEEKYRMLVETTNTGYVFLDEKGRVQDANQEYVRLAGFHSFQDISGHLVEEWTAEYDIKRSVREILKCFQGERLRDLRIDYINREKEITPIEINATAVAIRGKKQIVALCRDVTDRVLAEQTVKESEEQFRNLAEHSPNMIFIYAFDGRVVYVNAMCEKVLGYTREEMLSDSFHFMTLIAPESVEMLQQIHQNRLDNQHIPPYEYGLMTKDGRHLDALNNTAMIQYRGRPAMLGVVTDITERKMNEAQIQRDLQEKEVLLKEIHHRVKNNLQVISSLLGLQSQYIDDDSSLKLIKESQNRVRSIALVHENLYRSTNLGDINLNKYVLDLTRNLVYSYGKTPSQVDMDVHIDDLELPIDLVIPCGLIINELVSNSLKYAFPESHSEKPKISIAMKNSVDSGVEIKVQDNGIGLGEDFHLKPRDSLGLKLVQILAEDQLQGKLEYRSDQGTCFKISFVPNGQN